jgi:hypothetical protein
MGFNVGGAFAGLGSFAGGAAKGYEDMENIDQNRERLQLAKNADQRAADVHGQQMKQFAREDQFRSKVQDIVKKYGSMMQGDDTAPPDAAFAQPPTTPQQAAAQAAANAAPGMPPQAAALPVTGSPMQAAAMVPPDAQAAPSMGTVPPAAMAPRDASQVQVPMQAQQPPQRQGGVPGGIDLFSERNKRLMAMQAIEIGQAQLESGKIDGKAMIELQKTGQEMVRSGRAQAFRDFLTGDSKPLQQLMAKDGLFNPRLDYAKDENGFTQQMLVADDKNGQPVFKRPVGLIGMALGATEEGKTIMSEDKDNRTGALTRAQIKLAESHADYYKGKAASAGASAGIDLSAINNLVPDVNYSDKSGKIGFDKKPVKDTWAQEKIKELAVKAAQSGADEITAVQMATNAVRNATKAVDAIDDWSKPQKRQGAGYDEVRDMILNNMMAKAGGKDTRHTWAGGADEPVAKPMPTTPAAAAAQNNVAAPVPAGQPPASPPSALGNAAAAKPAAPVMTAKDRAWQLGAQPNRNNYVDPAKVAAAKKAMDDAAAEVQKAERTGKRAYIIGAHSAFNNAKSDYDSLTK